MLKESVLIWDHSELPCHSEYADKKVIFWNNTFGVQFENAEFILKSVEDHSDFLRTQYLSWIFNLGKIKISNKSLVDCLKIRPGFSYWWMTLLAEKCNWAKCPMIEDAIRLLAFNKWAENHSFNHIKLVSANSEVAQSISLWCQAKKINFEWQKKTNKNQINSWVKTFYLFLPSSFQVCGWLFRLIFQRFPFHRVDVHQWQKTKGNILFISYLLTPSAAKLRKQDFTCDYWGPLPRFLQKQNYKANWVYHVVSTAFFKNTKSISQYFRKKYYLTKQNQNHLLLDSFLDFRVIFRAFRDYIRLRNFGARLNPFSGTRQIPLGYLSPLFNKDWKRSFQGIPSISNALYLNLFEKALKSLPRQKIGFYLQENQPWETAFIHAWRSAGHGKLVGVPHSTVRFWDLRYFSDPRTFKRKGKNIMPMPDLVALNGNAMKKEFLKGKYPRNKITEVEALRYLHLGKPQKRVSAFAMPKETPQLLVLGDYLEENNKKMLHLLELVLPSLNKALRVTIKPHPACPIRPIRYPPIKLKTTSEPIEELLNKHYVAYASAMTTAAVDAYCKGIQVISVFSSNALNLSPLRRLKGVQFVETPEELKNALENAYNLSQRIHRKKSFFNSDNNLPRWKKIFSINPQRGKQK